MMSRTALFVSAMFAAALAATSGSAAPEAEQCLARPNGAAPAGKHWYYNTNRETNRKCWFLADEGAKAASAPPKRSTIPAQQPATAPSAETDQETPPAASTRAELIDEPKLEEPVVSASELRSEPASAATVGEAMTGWEVASRWPHESETFTPGRSMANDPAPVARSEIQSSPALVARRLVPVEQPPEPVDSSVAHLAAFEMKPAYVAAFILVAIVLGGVIVMFVASRRGNRREFSGQLPMPRGDIQQREMPWTRPAAVGPSSRHALRRIGA